MLRVATSTAGPLTMGLREEAHYFRPRPIYWGGLVNDTTPLKMSNIK